MLQCIDPEIHLHLTSSPEEQYQYNEPGIVEYPAELVVTSVFNLKLSLL